MSVREEAEKNIKLKGYEERVQYKDNTLKLNLNISNLKYSKKKV